MKDELVSSAVYNETLFLFTSDKLVHVFDHRQAQAFRC
jgi:hypothetical protein